MRRGDARDGLSIRPQRNPAKKEAALFRPDAARVGVASRRPPTLPRRTRSERHLDGLAGSSEERAAPGSSGLAKPSRTALGDNLGAGRLTAAQQSLTGSDGRITPPRQGTEASRRAARQPGANLEIPENSRE